WGDNRSEALRRMRRALDEYRVGGIKTNLPFHRRLLAHPAFVEGVYDTGFIDREKAILLAPYEADAAALDAALLAAALETASTAPPRPQNGDGGSPGLSPWRYGRTPWKV